MTRTGIIGGSAVYGIEGFDIKENRSVPTPFGRTSHDLLFGCLEGADCVFIPRHGIKHTHLPTEVNYKANIYALKKVGVERVISLSAVGSLREGIRPMDIVLPDQYIDRTNMARESSFFGNGIVAHVSFAEPVCTELREHIKNSSSDIGATLHPEGTYMNTEGPEFSTKAESFLYKSWGADIIGMTNMTEARLAREAGMCYSTIAMITDYDCWRSVDGHESVNAEMVMHNLEKAFSAAKNLLSNTLRDIPSERTCKCGEALKHAIVTKKEDVPKKTLEDLEPILKGWI